MVRDGSDLGKVDRRKLRVDRPSLRELMPVEAGGKNYEFKWEPRCRVCSAGNDVLQLVNSLLANGATYRDVCRAVESLNGTLPKNKQLTYQSIRMHQKMHMPFEAAAIREIIEKRAQDAQKNFIEGEGTILTPAAYAEVMMVKAHMQLMDEDQKVYPSEGLAAAAALHRFVSDEQGSLDAAQAVSQLGKIIEAVRAICSPDQMKMILNILDGGEVPRIEQAGDDDDEFDDSFDNTEDALYAEVDEDEDS